MTKRPVQHSTQWGRTAVEPQGDRKHYTITDPSGTPGSVYHLIEHQADGRGDLLTGAIIAEEPSPAGSGASGYDPDSLAAVVAGYYPVSSQSTPNPCTGENVSEYVIFSADQFAVQAYALEGLWRGRAVDALLVTNSTATTLCGSIREYIRQAVPLGLQYVLLVGDANDHVMWDDSTRWINGWRYPSQYRWVGDEVVPIAHKPSQPEKDYLPTFYVAAVDSPHVGWTHYTPYFATDLPYSDVDGDSLPDVIIGRLPVSSVNDMNAYSAKLATWFTSTNRRFGTTAALLSYAVNSGPIPGWPTAFAIDSLRQAYGPGIDLTEAAYVKLGKPTWGFYQSDSIRSIANAAASGGAEVIVWNLNSSDRYEYTGFWDAWKRDDWIPVGQTNRPFVSVGLSCGMNDFDRTEARSWTYTPPATFTYFDPVRPIVERLLFDPERGAIAQIGPTRASFTKGNPLIGREFLERLYEPGSTVGRAFLLAQRQCMLKYPEYRELFMSYVLLGDPRLGPSNVTGVASSPPVERTRLLRPEPNPFNPVTRLRYYLASTARSSLVVFDVHGRVVRRLLREAVRPRGWGDVRWDGKSDRGHPVASGMYFARMQAGGASYLQRVVLLK